MMGSAVRFRLGAPIVLPELQVSDLSLQFSVRCRTFAHHPQVRHPLLAFRSCEVVDRSCPPRKSRAAGERRSLNRITAHGECKLRQLIDLDNLEQTWLR